MKYVPYSRKMKKTFEPIFNEAPTFFWATLLTLLYHNYVGHNYIAMAYGVMA